MRNESSYLTCKQVAAILKCTTVNVIYLIKKGKIVAKQSMNGRYHIDKAEFYRLYPQGNTEPKETTIEKNDSEKALEEKIMLLEKLIEEHKKQNQSLLDYIKIISDEKLKMQEMIRVAAPKPRKWNIFSRKG